MRFLLGYLDPNSGSVILQAIIGAFLAAGYFFRHTLAGFFNRFRKSSGKPSLKDEDSKKETE